MGIPRRSSLSVLQATRSCCDSNGCCRCCCSIEMDQQWAFLVGAPCHFRRQPGLLTLFLSDSGAAGAAVLPGWEAQLLIGHACQPSRHPGRAPHAGCSPCQPAERPPAEWHASAAATSCSSPQSTPEPSQWCDYLLYHCFACFASRPQLCPQPSHFNCHLRMQLLIVRCLQSVCLFAHAGVPRPTQAIFNCSLCIQLLDVICACRCSKACADGSWPAECSTCSHGLPTAASAADAAPAGSEPTRAAWPDGSSPPGSHERVCGPLRGPHR